MDDISHDDQLLASDLPDIHLWDYVWVVLRRFRLASIIFLSVVVLAAIYTWTRTPRYKSTARILVERKSVDLTDVKDAYEMSSTGVSQREFIQTQAELITSLPVLEMVFAKLDFTADPTFLKKKDPIRAFREIISVTPKRNSQLIDVSVVREDKRQATLMVNALVDAFVAESRKRRAGISEEGLYELRKKAKDLRTKLDEASRVLQQFMVANNIVSFEKAENLILERLRDLNGSLSAAQPRRMVLEAKLGEFEKVIDSGESAASIPDVLRSPVVRELKMQQSVLAQKHSEMLQRLGANHPQLQAVTTQMEALEASLAVEAILILDSIKSEYKQALTEERLIREALTLQEAQVFRFNQLSVQHDMLKGYKDSVESNYRQIIDRIEQIDLNRLGGQGENIFVIARGQVPTEPSWPNSTKNMMLAIMAGGIAAVGLCFFLDYMDTTVNTERDVRSVVKTDVLGTVPHMPERRSVANYLEFLSLHEPRSHFAEAFRGIRTALRFRTSGTPAKSFVVSSTFPSEGKSMVAVNIAIAKAQINLRTLIIDCDMRKPRLHKVFDVERDKGLSDILSDPGITIEDVAVETKIQNLHFLPSGASIPNPVELLDSSRFETFLREIEFRYDVVIFDTPPGIALVDAIVAGRRTDGAVLVVHGGVTPKEAVRQFADLMRQADVKLLGVVLNNLEEEHSLYYGRYYYYGYYEGAGEDSSKDSVAGGLKTKVMDLLSGRSRQGRA